MINREDHIQPMTLRERFGCLGILLLLVGFWGAILLACVEYGRRHPHELKQAVTWKCMHEPSVEIVP